MQLEFDTYDVFTGKQFSGNPLAVVYLKSDISASVMQVIAGEFNYSETTFVSKGDDPSYPRVRIFTPKKELAFAGHPIVGTASSMLGRGLYHQELKGFLLNSGRADIELQENGLIQFKAPVAYASSDHFPADLAARALALDEKDIAGPGVIAGTGSDFPMAELVSEDALARAVFQVAEAEGTPLDGHFLIYWRKNAGTVKMRLFAPAYGINEDAATGSAAAALSGYLASEACEENGYLHFEFEQGEYMGRPSQIYSMARKANGKVDAVYVKGQAVKISSGTLEIKEGTAV